MLALLNKCEKVAPALVVVSFLVGPSNAEVICGLSLAAIDSVSNCYDVRGAFGDSCEATSTGPCSRDYNDPEGFEVGDNSPVFRIPIVFHIIKHETTGEGSIPLSRIQSQIEGLNQDYNALPHSISGFNTAEESVPTRIVFFLAGVDSVSNTSWFRMPVNGSAEDSSAAALNWDPESYMNVYTMYSAPFGGPSGRSTVPWACAGNYSDGIRLWWPFIGRPDYTGVAIGRILVHEVGHYLGLLHPQTCFNCDEQDCDSEGDLICDLPPMLDTRCDTKWQSCAEQDSIENKNLMSGFLSDVCSDRFSPEQVARMRCALQTYRPSVYDSISVSISTNVDSNIVTCPKGDRQSFVVSLDFDHAGMKYDIAASELSLVPIGPDSLYQLWTDIEADSAATSENGYETTITHSRIGGCDTDSVVVLLSGVPIGKAYFKSRSYDYHPASPGGIDTSDLAAFAADLGDTLYQECSDFDQKTTSYMDVDASDTADFSAHYGHNVPASKPAFGLSELIVSEQTAPSGTASLELSLNNPGEFFVFGAVLRPSEVLEFVDWTPATTSGVDVYLTKSVDDEGPRVTVIAIADEGVEFESVPLGTVMFSESQEIQLESDLRLSFGGLASRDGDVWSVRVQSKARYVDEAAVVRVTRLEQNRPNPFNPFTEIRYSLAREGQTELNIYDVAGRLVRTLVASPQPAGEYQVVWNGRSNQGVSVASGIYVYRLKTVGFEESRRLVVLR